MLQFFSSRLDRNAVAANLRKIIDEEEVDPKSPTLYAGDRSFVGEVGPERFKVQRRPPVHWVVWWLTPGQWFKPVVNGTVTSRNDGTHIELVGGTPIWIKIIWVLALLGAASSIGMLIVFSYPFTITHDPARSGADFLLGIILLNLVAGLFVVLPIIGWFLTRKDISVIVNELKSRLDLKPIE
jgi:hypothetical protein